MDSKVYRHRLGTPISTDRHLFFGIISSYSIRSHGHSFKSFGHSFYYGLVYMVQGEHLVLGLRLRGSVGICAVFGKLRPARLIRHLFRLGCLLMSLNLYIPKLNTLCTSSASIDHSAQGILTIYEWVVKLQLSCRVRAIVRAGATGARVAKWKMPCVS